MESNAHASHIPRITPCLWFDFNAEEAAAHYLGIFKKGRILDVTRYGENGHGPKGAVLTLRIELAGQTLILLNGGPTFKLSEAASLSVDCKTQEEIDYYWHRLSEGGATSQCGWLKDRFGLSWQVIPSIVYQVLTAGDEARADRVMRALLGMTKLVIADLENAASS